MFGIIYGLLMAGACLFDSVKKENENEDARKKSYLNGGQWELSNGKTYFLGQNAYKTNENGHEVIKNVKTNQTIYDYTNAQNVKERNRCEENWNQRINNAKEKNEKYFIYIPYFKNDFSEKHPAGMYELSSFKPYFTTTKNGKHYKMYGYIRNNTLFPDRKNEIEISDKEWLSLGGKIYDIEKHNCYWRRDNKYLK